jgi:phage-related protein
MSYSINYFHARVKAEIDSWPDGVLADYAWIVELLMEFGPNLRMPHSRAVGGGLFELRPRGREGIGRAFYCFVIGQRVVILHAFVKKTQDTPEQELRIARKRMKEVQNGWLEIWARFPWPWGISPECQKTGRIP